MSGMQSTHNFIARKTANKIKPVKMDKRLDMMVAQKHRTKRTKEPSQIRERDGEQIEKGSALRCADPRLTKARSVLIKMIRAKEEAAEMQRQQEELEAYEVNDTDEDEEAARKRRVVHAILWQKYMVAQKHRTKRTKEPSQIRERDGESESASHSADTRVTEVRSALTEVMKTKEAAAEVLKRREELTACAVSDTKEREEAAEKERVLHAILWQKHVLGCEDFPDWFPQFAKDLAAIDSQPSDSIAGYATVSNSKK